MMMDTARRVWQVVVLGGAVLACQAPPSPSSERVLPAGDGRSAAGAGVVTPAGGGAPAEPNGGVGGNASRPEGAGASGTGGKDTGSGGNAGSGANGGADGASGRDGDSSSGDQQRYALLIESASSPSAAPSGARDVLDP